MNRPSLRQLQDELAAAAEDALEEDALVFRSMFGGVGVYAHGRFFAVLLNAGLVLKLPPDAQAELLKIRGARPLQFGPDGPVSKQYIVVPDKMRRDPHNLAVWVRRSVEFARTLPAPKSRRRKTV